MKSHNNFGGGFSSRPKFCWASGVFLYELLVGFTPFCFENKDLNPTIIYQNILNPKYEIEYPSRLSSEVVTDVSNFDRIESKVDFFAGEPYDFSDARQWDVDF